MQSNECAKIFLEVIPRIMHFIRKEMRGCAETDLTIPQYRVLIRLSRAFSTNLELADAIGVRPSTMTRMVDILAKKKLVFRKPQTHDRRQIEISLTKSGIKLVESIQKNMRSKISKLLDQTDSETRLTIVQALHSIRELLSL